MTTGRLGSYDQPRQHVPTSATSLVASWKQPHRGGWQSLLHPPREATAFTAPLMPKLRLNCLFCHVLLFLVGGVHSRDSQLGAIQIPGNRDRVAGCLRQLFVGP
jgi:hypothetical protein